jgi:PAS domain S-box-containing protein
MLDTKGFATHESVHRRKDGTTFPVEITANNMEFHGKTYTFSFVKDITERKRAEEALRESEARLKIAMDLARLVQWEYDIKTEMFSFDDQFYALYGTTAELENGSLMSRDVYARKFIPPEEYLIVAGGIAEVLANSSNQLEHRIIRADGEERHIVVRGEAVYDQTGCTIKIRGVNQDITERKRMEVELRKSKEEYQAIVNAIDGYIYIASRDFRIQFMNEGLSNLSGYREPGDFCYKVLKERDTVCPECQSFAVFEGKTVRKEWFNPKVGRWYYMAETPIFHADGSITRQVLGTDITDRKLAEEQLRQKKQQLEALNNSLEQRVEEEVAKNREKDHLLIQQNRQAALGETLDHIAHQWKQPINAISLIIQDMGETYVSGEMTKEYVYETVGKILDLVEHMAQTIAVFRDFYRPEKVKTTFRIKESIDKALIFVEPALKFNSIAVELDADPELSAIGYPKEYAQVLLNILTNARDTFNERGVENPVVKVKAYAEDKKAVVTITDNAGGIPDTIIDKIFDLYFTTKKSSGGTGVGLYMSKKIIENNMGGSLRVGNINCGAQFRIELDMLTGL